MADEYKNTVDQYVDQQFKDAVAQQLYSEMLRLTAQVSPSVDPTKAGNLQLDYPKAALAAYMAAEVLYDTREAIRNGRIKFNKQ